MNSSSADLTESTFPETESFYWDVLVTLGGRVVESFKLSSEFRSFSLSLDERKLYSVLVAATSETGERVTLGSVFPYQRELTRAGGLSSTVLKEVYRLYSLRGIRGNESVEQAKLFNWAKFTSSLEERSSAFRNGENITVRNIDKVAKSIVEKKFTLSMIKVISVESDRGSR